MAVARIAGIMIPQKKRVEIALTYVRGIGRPLSKKILRDAEVSGDTKTESLTEEEVNRIRDQVRQYKVEGDLRRDILSHIKRLREIKCYRGSRHFAGLPARGQRTKTNSRTVRGNVRRTAGSGKRMLTKT